MHSGIPPEFGGLTRGKIEQPVIYEHVRIPAIAMLLTRRQLCFDRRSPSAIDLWVLGANQIIDDQRVPRLNQPAQAIFVGQVKTGLRINGPVASLAGPLAEFAEHLRDLVDHFAVVVGLVGVGGIGTVEAERAIAGLNGGLRGFA